jgi:cyclopropane-fatty-acyl-phospholipid synthase
MAIQTKNFDRKAIGYHYDVSNDFYALFLDPRMVYTCAYYRRPDGDLATAQEDKLDLVCRKLDLQPGDRLLDIGCGWGALVMWAAERYGVEVHGVTLSGQQAEWAQASIRRAGLQRRAHVDFADYRDLDPALRFDKIAAVGVIEHVGPRNTPAYLASVWDRLVPGGKFLNHGITHHKLWRRGGTTRFLRKYVFPNGEMQDISETLDKVERARFEVLDVEGLRPHYARTTRQWVERLLQNADRARALVGERTYRIWISYLAGSSAAFDIGSVGLYQVVARKPDPAAAPLVPTTRERWYTPRVEKPETVREAG